MVAVYLYPIYVVKVPISDKEAAGKTDRELIDLAEEKLGKMPSIRLSPDAEFSEFTEGYEMFQVWHSENKSPWYKSDGETPL